ncbi:MAG: hypothetical protein AAF849_13275 [Bacteroidota bacterium]
MAASQAEFSLSPNDLSVVASVELNEGNSTAGFEGQAQGGTPTPGLTNRLIQTDQPFHVAFDWAESGSFAPFLAGGKWKLSVIFDAIGVNSHPAAITDTTNSTGGGNYTNSLDVAENTLSPGMYKIIARMQWHFGGGNPGPLVLFQDLGMIEVYQDS